MDNGRIKSLIGFLAVTLLIIITFFAIVYGINHGASTQKPQRPSIPPVTLTPLLNHTIPLTVSAYGYTLLPDSVVIRASSAGKIDSIHFTAGEKVKKGQLLFVILASDVTQQMRYLKPKLNEAKAAYDRYVSVNTQTPGSVAKQTLLSLQATYLQYLAQYNELDHQSRITAAVDGTISDTNLAVGDLVSANDVLATISSKDILQVSYHLPSQWAQKAKLGQPITFISSDNESYQGSVSYLASDLSLNNQGINLRADIAKPNHLLANEFGQVIQVINPKQSILAIPQNLAQTDAQGYFVLGVKDHKVVSKYFTPGYVTHDGLITVTSGLQERDAIISNPSLYSVGQKVEIAP
jgi:RND family efflux transporter MFP subunit